ncbi:DUF4124 domain-containing protein [Plasticicumulans sp.]|uniref:DUF4124 domain-containing protein n=1 Tax=Plasticicumulans sp. TaxID=2307179 RepID=UPI002B937EDE|nr:DUF4124 domain-containing protein [Plasticicumulans sp.]MBS0601294.1 DUF4124 domain-containing protein [Pseudomonadota bacterium]HMW29716.1 DUF4124 domain-containing protein [Plasticicumulans sp.]HMW43451.1 DUF4124 domain-containing protein [Plasticicumulans sp.]HNE02800.1 DUF4124 domain-containing protein [Plasticicumulans sp.]HNF65819.1 DUF4124 domain-containing protein [Plasticicumulans sp.]
MRALLLPLFAALLAAPAVTDAGEIYRWKDRDGAWHYGDRPPPGADAEWYDPRPRAGVDRQATPPAAGGSPGAPPAPKPSSGPR